VNDAAERCVKLGTDYTGVITKSEETRQDIIQGVELTRRAFPKATKKCFLEGGKATDSIEELMEATDFDARNSL
jgi:phosphoribosylanthranilate isomerase